MLYSPELSLCRQCQYPPSCSLYLCLLHEPDSPTILKQTFLYTNQLLPGYGPRRLLQGTWAPDAGPLADSLWNSVNLGHLPS